MGFDLSARNKDAGDFYWVDHARVQNVILPNHLAASFKIEDANVCVVHITPLLSALRRDEMLVP